MKNILRLTALILALLPVLLAADTYDERTLVRIEVPQLADRDFIQASPIDVVDAGLGWAKALLRPAEFDLLAKRGLKVTVLSEEMAQDRALWREADAAIANKTSPAYYTASKFNTVNPPAGSLMEHLLALHNAHPDITRLYDIGNAASGKYDIIALEVSLNPDTKENEPKIRIYGTIHGDEKSATMVTCDVVDWILANYPANADAVKMVEKAELWFIPIGNPDGVATSSRYNSKGIDLNRNFWGPNGNEEGTPFSEPETQAIRDLTEVMGKRFASSLSFHSGATVFNSVYNYTSAATTDEPIFFSARTGGPQGAAVPAPFSLAEAYKNGVTTSGFWYTNGADWYITRGDTNDWSYAIWSDIDTTLELTLTKTPPASSIPTFCAEHRQAVLNYILASFQGISGRMTDFSSGAPLNGTVTVTATASAYISTPHPYQKVYTDPDVGDYHRVLQPATYKVVCAATGYPTLTIEGVVVTAGATTVLDCPMGSCAPVIASHPGNQTIAPGQTATLSATVTGSGLTYHWYQGNSGDTSTPVGTNSSSFTTPPLNNTTSYWVRVSNTCGTADSNTAVITVSAITCLFCDDFGDSVLNPNWSYSKPSWSETGGSLVGTSAKGKLSAIASPVYAGCSNCTMEATVKTAGGKGNTLWIFAWYADSKNRIEVQMKEGSDKWTLRQVVNGLTTAKTTVKSSIVPNVFYDVKLAYDGANVTLTVDGNSLATIPASAIPSGTIGFQVKNTTGSLGNVAVN